jgi:hypothetical protein
VTTEDDVARDLLASSQQLRDELVAAVAKLDSYIEQLRDEMSRGSEQP